MQEAVAGKWRDGGAIADFRSRSQEPRVALEVWVLTQKPPPPAGRMTAVWVQAAAWEGLFGLFAAVLAADLALVLAAFDAGFAFVGAALFAGVTGEGTGAEGGEGQEGEKRFHGYSKMDF
jgi:hypothetical protein